MTAPRVYACFDAAGCKNPAASDLKYYFLLRAWEKNGPLARTFIDVHRAAPTVKPRLSDMRSELAKRLQGSDLLLLILSERTASSGGWISWEIDFAAYDCRLPIVCAYTGRGWVGQTSSDHAWWPGVLRRAVSERRTTTLHVQFQPRALARAFEQCPPARHSLTAN